MPASQSQTSSLHKREEDVSVAHRFTQTKLLVFLNKEVIAYHLCCHPLATSERAEPLWRLQPPQATPLRDS